MATTGHGKVILLGEHAVVYGRPALAQAVDCAATVRAVRRQAPNTTLHIRPWNVLVDTSATRNRGCERLQDALKAVRALYPDDSEFALQAEMRIPAQAGLGSSAALGLAVLRAMDEARGFTRCPQEEFERSFAWERIFHGEPSGVDGALATYGGLAIYRQGHPLRQLERRTPPSYRLLAADSGRRPAAREMVALVRSQWERERNRIEATFDAIASLVDQALAAFERDEWVHVGRLMTANHHLLADLGLSNERLERMVAAALREGALGAKLTGAGGGGCMIALTDGSDSHSRVMAALQALGSVYDV